jgi:phosphate:Na+ symporter
VVDFNTEKMNYSFLDFLTLVGSLGLFLFGMKLMSEGLQKVAGDKMRSILAAMTSTRLTGVLTGFLITAVIQSSSATTVMIVSFVNAGLLSLTQSIGVIMGANIGTTITAWIISLLGFKVNISALSIPLIGIGFPLLFSKKNVFKSWGEVIIGFSFLFMGLDFLKDSVPDIKSNPQILEFLSQYTELGFLSVIIFLLIGTLLTIVIQSSSATMALTLVMCNNGWIPFDLAAAMVLGENIGTTITANIAAIIANVSAKRAARAHFIFNVFGVIWMLLIYRLFLNAVDYIVVHSDGVSPFESPLGIPIALSIFHSSFNILNVIILVWFAPLIVNIVTKITPEKKGVDEEFRLQHIQTGLLSTSELSILQARKEISVISRRTCRMFDFVKEMAEQDIASKSFSNIKERLTKYEDIIDRMEIEMANYLSQITEGELSKAGTIRVKSMYKIIDEIESIADMCYNIGLILEKNRNEKGRFSSQMVKNLNQMFQLIDLALEEMNKNIDVEYKEANITKAIELETMINKLRDNLRENHLMSIKEQKYSYQNGIYYMEIISLCEKIGDHVININEAAAECKIE